MIEWDWEYSLEILPDLIKALRITVFAALVGMTLAMIFGLLLALGRRSKFKVLSLPIGGFIEFVRTTPLLVQLYFLFYVLPHYGILLSPFEAGFIGLGLHYSTYLSEVYRAGIEAIPRDQWEAAIALNFSWRKTWTRIILPQALPPMLPVFGNYFIAMFKETPLLAAITVIELLETAKTFGDITFKYLEPFTMVGLLFLALSYPSALLIRRLEARFVKQS
jgi:polar amino acid transport system permease protein